MEEFESWHEDLMAWERYQDELERIKGEIGEIRRKECIEIACLLRDFDTPSLD